MAAIAAVGAVALSTTVFASAHRGGSTQVAGAARVDVEQQVATSLQGIQIDVWDGGTPSPGRTTTMFVHRGDRAAELYWTTDGWCVARSFTWEVEHARKVGSFDVRYTVVQENTDCVMSEGDVVLFRVAETGSVNGRATWTGMYLQPNEQWSLRTQCSSRWDDPQPCGFDAVGALITTLWH